MPDVGIEITLGGALVKYLPQGEKGNQFTLSNNAPLSLDAVLSLLDIGTEQRLMTILNGNVIQREQFSATQLHDGDKLSLMPPIVAG